MQLLGDRNWWLPGWLDRRLPTVHVEATHDAAHPDRERPTRQQTPAGQP
jgi:RND superfamily putative drug exporter